MGYILVITIGLISAGHFWFKMRNGQKKGQPFIIHLIDVVAALALMLGWVMAVALLLYGFTLPRVPD